MTTVFEVHVNPFRIFLFNAQNWGYIGLMVEIRRPQTQVIFLKHPVYADIDIEGDNSYDDTDESDDE